MLEVKNDRLETPQVSFQPLVLSEDWVDAKIEEVVELCVDADKVNWAQVEAVVHVPGLDLGHGEPVFVVAEVAAKENFKQNVK